MLPGREIAGYSQGPLSVVSSFAFCYLCHVTPTFAVWRTSFSSKSSCAITLSLRCPDFVVTLLLPPWEAQDELRSPHRLPACWAVSMLDCDYVWNIYHPSFLCLTLSPSHRSLFSLLHSVVRKGIQTEAQGANS